MGATVVKQNPQINYWEASQRTFLKRFEHSLFNGGDVLFGNVSSHHFLHELEPTAPWPRLKLNLHVSVLAMASGLLLVLVFRFDGPAYRLLVSHLGEGRHQLHAKLSLRLFHGNLGVGLAKRSKQHLTGQLLAGQQESGIFLHEAVQRVGHLVQVGFTFGRDRGNEDRFSETDGLQHQRCLTLGERVASVRGRQLGHGTDVTRYEATHRLLVLAPGHEDLPNPLGLRLVGVPHVGITAYGAADDPEIRELANELVRGGLENQRGQRASGVCC